MNKHIQGENKNYDIDILRSNNKNSTSCVNACNYISKQPSIKEAFCFKNLSYDNDKKMNYTNSNFKNDLETKCKEVG